MHNYIPYIALLSPLFFATTALASWFRFGQRLDIIKNLAMTSSLVSIATAFALGIIHATNGQMTSALFGMNGLGLSIRLDMVSIVMYTMIAILGFIIMKYSFNYLNGDTKQGSFLGRLAAALAAVQLLALAGNIVLLMFAWVVTSISLHRLLMFYNQRPLAVIAARKKFLVARISDTFLLSAFVLIYRYFETGNLQEIFVATGELISASSLPLSMEIACILLAMAAIFKSAQFPTHGWLIEVMETPTPVSALLHAGLLNAGPFLIIRFAFLFDGALYAPGLMMVVGGITALFGSLVFLTQTSAKTTLAYSSIAHMGFSLLMCGLGAYPAAMLHLVAHSFYKAHSFLSSGSVIETLRASRVRVSQRTGNPYKIGLSIVIASGIFYGLSLLAGINPLAELPLLFISIVIVLGLAQIISSAVDVKPNLQIIATSCLMAVMVTLSFLILESGASYLLAESTPALAALSFGEIIIMSTLLVCFATVVGVQIVAPQWKHKPQYQALAIHVRNGFYANILFDNLVGAWKVNIPHVELNQSGELEEVRLRSELVPLR